MSRVKDVVGRMLKESGDLRKMDKISTATAADWLHAFAWLVMDAERDDGRDWLEMKKEADGLREENGELRDCLLHLLYAGCNARSVFEALDTQRGWMARAQELLKRTEREVK